MGWFQLRLQCPAYALHPPLIHRRVHKQLQELCGLGEPRHWVREQVIRGSRALSWHPRLLLGHLGPHSSHHQPNRFRLRSIRRNSLRRILGLAGRGRRPKSKRRPRDAITGTQMGGGITGNYEMKRCDDLAARTHGRGNSGFNTNQ